MMCSDLFRYLMSSIPLLLSISQSIKDLIKRNYIYQIFASIKISSIIVLICPGMLFANAYDSTNFKDKYLNQYKKLNDQLSNFKARMKHDRIDHITKNTYLILDDNFQSRTEYKTEKALPNSPYLRIRSLSGKTIFDIQQLTKESEFTITSLDSATQGRESRWSKPYVLAAYHIMNASLKDILEAPSTKVISVKEDTNRDILNVVIEISPTKFIFHKVELSLLPKENLAISEYSAFANVRYADKKLKTLKYHGTVKYAKPITSLIPQEVIIEDTTIDEGEVIAKNVSRAELIEVEKGSVTEEEFTLAYFGIDGFEKKEERHLSPLIVVNISIITLILIYFVYKDKKTTKSQEM